MEKTINELLLVSSKEECEPSFDEDISFYIFHIAAIERACANFYVQDKTAKDKDVVACLRNIRKNYHKPLVFFMFDLEQEIVNNLLDILERHSISSKSLLDIIDHILEEIKSESNGENSQNYLKDVACRYGKLGEEEQEAYTQKVISDIESYGISKELISKALEEGTGQFTKKDEEIIIMKREYFSCPIEGREKFILENYIKMPFLIDYHLQMCGVDYDDNSLQDFTELVVFLEEAYKRYPLRYHICSSLIRLYLRDNDTDFNMFCEFVDNTIKMLPTMEDMKEGIYDEVEEIEYLSTLLDIVKKAMEEESKFM